MHAHPNAVTAMRKLVVVALLAAATAAVLATPAAANQRATNGKLVIHAENPAAGTDVIYTVDPDGTDRRLVGVGDSGQWSPDGTRFTLFQCFAGENDCFFGTFNPDNHHLVNLHLETRYPHLDMYCFPWKPNGARLACGADGHRYGRRLNGVYTIRSSDGGGLHRVTATPGADACAGDFSPNGKRIVFGRTNDAGVTAIFTVKVDGSGLRRITPPGMEINFNCGSWSAHRYAIVFSAHVPNADYHSSIWVVHPDGSGLRRIPVAGCGAPFSDPAGIGCFNPSWSPDGRKIVFGRQRGEQSRDIYTANSDGSGLFRVTNMPAIEEYSADWGTHRVTP